MPPQETRFHTLAARWRERFRYVPDEPQAFGFEIAAIAGRFILDLPVLGGVLRVLGRYASSVIEAMSPAMPLDIEANNSFSKDPWGFYWGIFKYSFPLTVLFCYVLNAIFSYRSGTFWPAADPTRIWYLTDGYNAVLYLLVCPLYVSAAVCLLVTTAVSWRKLNGYYSNPESSEGSGLSSSTRIAGFITISLLITGFYTAEYISDLANPETVGRTYWFFDERNGQRILNKAGIYYAFMNAVLLFFTSMAAFCYIAISIEMFRIGKNIKTSVFVLEMRPDDAEAVDRMLTEKEERIRATLSDFSYSYIMAKFLVFAYALNITIWQISPAGEVGNVHSAIIGLMIIGFFFLIIPRLYLNSKWHRLKIEFIEAGDKDAATQEAFRSRVEYRDLKAREYRRMAMFLNGGFSILIGLILVSQYRVNFLDVGGTLATMWTEFWFPDSPTSVPD